MSSIDYLVVGAGAFGASTALHLAQQFPSARIVLVDRYKRQDNIPAASSDMNKVVRSDYPDDKYAKLALEAMQSWRNDATFSPAFHESGVLFVADKYSAPFWRKARLSYEKLGYRSRAEVLSPEEAQRRFPAYSAANWDDAVEAIYNPEGGWAEADVALQSLNAAVAKAGVKFVKGNVNGLVLGEDRTCRGVRIVDDNGSRTEVISNKTILCAGAYTAQILADTDSEWQELQIGDRLVAAAASQCTAKCTPEQEAQFKDAPVLIQCLWSGGGDVIPPLRGKVKINCGVTYTNKGNSIFSAPPADHQASGVFGHALAAPIRDEVASVLKLTHPDLKLDTARACWDSVGRGGNWLIDEHPHCKNLVVAGGGSFHSWKFMPILGKYIVQRVTGTLEPDMAAKWAWDRNDTTPTNAMYTPRRDLKDIGPFKGWRRPE